MRNKVLRLVAAAMLMAAGICGCRKAPESSADGDIFHAKDSVEKCASIYKSSGETVLEEADNRNVYVETEKILLAKLSGIGMEEIDIYKITQYQKENVTFYKIEFTPSYGGMEVAHEFGSVASGEIFPLGKAWIFEENIAALSLVACLGKVETQKKCGTVLSW